MNHPILGSTYQYHADAGRFINEKHERIAAVIRDYDPELELAWIPPENRDDSDTKPFCIIHNSPDGSRVPVSFWREDQIDERLIEWCFENDFKKHSPDAIFNRLEARNLAKKLMETKSYQAEDEARKEWARWVLETNKTVKPEDMIFRG